jgi:hypothetical protein
VFYGGRLMAESRLDTNLHHRPEVTNA